MSEFRSERNWYAVHTRANFEQTVVDYLDAHAVETYYPVLQESRRWADRQKLIYWPVFPGYVFVRIARTAEERLMVLKARGAVRILGIGGEIEPVPDLEIESIRRMLAGNVPCSRHAFLREGMRVRVRRGALEGLTGILVRVKNHARIVVAVELLQQAVAADINANDVEALRTAEDENATPAARPIAPRSTENRRSGAYR